MGGKKTTATKADKKEQNNSLSTNRGELELLLYVFTQIKRESMGQIT